MSGDLLRSLSLNQLMAECAEASALPAIDLDGCVALLEEARRRAELGELEPLRFEVVKAALEPCRIYPADNIFVLLLEESHPWHRHRQALRQMVGEAPPKFLYHGTLRSRLGSIAREGLIPAKRRKHWPGRGLTEHAASGVFFETRWRDAKRWVGAAAYDDAKMPTKGAIIRLDASNLEIETDVRSGGAVVVRRDRIPVDGTAVLLFPLSVTQAWVPIAEAVEIVKRTRKRT
jgi:hypothetical protein